MRSVRPVKNVYLDGIGPRVRITTKSEYTKQVAVFHETMLLASIHEREHPPIHPI